MALATLRIETNDPSSPKDIPLSSLIGNDAQVANCPEGYAGDSVSVAQGEHAEQTLAEANAAAMAAAEDGLNCVLLEFDPPSDLGSTPIAVVEQSDGKVLVGGNFSSPDLRMVRLNFDGTHDTSFNFPYSWTVTAIRLQSDGKIIVVGNGTPCCVRLNSDGTADPSFASVTSNAIVWDAAIQTDGKIILVGNFTTINGATHYHIVRLNTDGTIDSSFTPPVFGGASFAGDLYRVVMRSDGRMYVGGHWAFLTSSSRRALVCLNSDGSIYSGFTDPLITDSGSFAGAVVDMAVDPSDGVVFVGSMTSVSGVAHNGGVGRVSAAGVRDPAFNPSTGYPQMTVLRLSSGDYVFFGSFSSFAGAARSRIAKLLANGTHDAAFQASANQGGLEYKNGFANANGWFYLVGSFTEANGQPRVRAARWLNDGTLA